ncbi:MAG: energy transducer TonB [Flavobacteriales bacterium]|nr:energy transducer TonB [Flavobacteriales bacterium]
MKLRTTLPFLALLFAPMMYAQVTRDPDVAPERSIEKGADDPNSVNTIVEVMPSFPGGQEEMFKYLGQEIKYPANAIEEGIQGVVYVSFLVEQDGSINDAIVLRGIGGGCDEEALRVVNSMPNWTPGKQGGKAVRVKYNLPIRFTLRKRKKK